MVFIGLAIWLSTLAPISTNNQALNPTANPTDTPAPKSLKPELTLKGTEEYEANGKTWIRYRLNVENWQDFPSEFFEPSPDLPPCGLNENSARAWVEIYNGDNDSYIYGFCAFSEPKDLQLTWFAVEKGSTPPSTVYIVINDRQEEKLYVSNKVAIK